MHTSCGDMSKNEHFRHWKQSWYPHQYSECLVMWWGHLLLGYRCFGPRNRSRSFTTTTRTRSCDSTCVSNSITSWTELRRNKKRTVGSSIWTEVLPSVYAWTTICYPNRSLQYLRRTPEPIEQQARWQTFIEQLKHCVHKLSKSQKVDLRKSPLKLWTCKRLKFN